MKEVKVRMITNSKYQVFDYSGKLPISIIFSLVRRSPEDTDPRPVVLGTAHSILDVPYALSNKLLVLRIHDDQTKRDTEVDIKCPIQRDSHQDSVLMLPSPVSRVENYRRCFVDYEYVIKPGSDLASLFESGKTYSIRVRPGCASIGEAHFPSAHAQAEEQPQTEGPSDLGEKIQVVISKSEGRALFTVVPSLPWPPKLQTYLRCASTSSDNAPLLEFIALNTGNTPIAVQTRGRQRFLVPYDRLRTGSDRCARLLDSKESVAAASGIQVIALATDAIVRRESQPGGCDLHAASVDLRPRLEQLVTLEPGEPVRRCVDADRRLAGLPDGRYGLRAEPRGMWWCEGRCEDWGAAGDRVPQDLFSAWRPPVMLECEDSVEVVVEGGRVSWKVETE